MVFGFFCELDFLKTRLGYFSLAIRENEIAAQSLGISTFRVKIKVMGLSAGLTSLGGILYAFYQNNLFPEQTFALSRSIELTIGTIVGSWNTFLAPLLGRLFLSPQENVSVISLAKKLWALNICFMVLYF